MPWGGLRDDVDTLMQFNHPQASAVPNTLQREVGSLAFYPYLLVIEKLAIQRKQLTGSLRAGNRSSWSLIRNATAVASWRR